MNNLYVFTSGQYSNYSVASIYRREEPITSAEVAEIGREWNELKEAYRQRRLEAWVNYARAHNFNEPARLYTESRLTTQELRLWNQFISPWLKSNPYPNTHTVLSQHGFVEVDFAEIHMGEHTWELHGGLSDD